MCQYHTSSNILSTKTYYVIQKQSNLSIYLHELVSTWFPQSLIIGQGTDRFTD